jgi:hypothetical protein
MTTVSVSADPRITDAREVLTETRKAEWPADRDSEHLIGWAFTYLAEEIAIHDGLVADEAGARRIEAAADRASEAAKALTNVLRERREWDRKQKKAEAEALIAARRMAQL